MSSTRNLRKKKVVIAPALVHKYVAICNFYGISRHETSAVFNLCLDTVAKGIEQMQAQERKAKKAQAAATAAKEQTNGAATTGADAPTTRANATETAEGSENNQAISSHAAAEPDVSGATASMGASI